MADSPTPRPDRGLRSVETRSVETLPIDALRADFLDALQDGPVVVSSPTGSGKSTQVPRWCPGPVLVVEPRRVACRSLAQRVAELEGSDLGADVGYQVRDEQRASPETRILFVTPGIALRRSEDWSRFDTVVLDEFHERGLETDLLLALLRRRFQGHLVVMSATLDGDRVAQHVGGRHLHAEGRRFDVDVRYLAGKALLPTVDGLEARLRDALAACRDLSGDILVFLPGKAEIGRCRRVAERAADFDVLELHGGLSLKEQNQVFQPSRRRKVVLATNVAETSLTLPGIGVVVDSGLVRQTRYHRDRGFLTLVPIADDSAEQRRGRAGRLADGVCLRLWSPQARLEARTAPEIFRESLVPLVLAALACGERAESLEFFDPPPAHALETATVELQTLGAVDAEGHLRDQGRQLFSLPLDAVLGRWLVEAKASGETELLDDMIDLVAALAGQSSLFSRLPPEDEEEEPTVAACDAVALIRAVRQPRHASSWLRPHALREVQGIRRRLRRLFDVPENAPTDPNLDRRRLALALLAADPRSAHLRRQRGRRDAWSNGGTEIELGRDSLANRLEDAEALVVLATRAVGLGGRDTRVLITAAMPIPVRWIAEAGLGRERLGEAEVQDGRVVATLERVFARRVLERRPMVPEGQMARDAVVDLILAGRLFSGLGETLQVELEAQLLAAELIRRGLVHDLRPRDVLDGVTEVDAWLHRRLKTLGFEHGDDLELLDPSDLEIPPLPPDLQQQLDRHYPRRLVMPGASYALRYDLAQQEVVLEQMGGRRVEVPPATHLPRLPGLRVRLLHKGVTRLLRERVRG